MKNDRSLLSKIRVSLCVDSARHRAKRFHWVVVGTSQIGGFSRRFYYMGACLLSFLFKQVLTCAFLCASVITSVYEAVVELRV